MSLSTVQYEDTAKGALEFIKKETILDILPNTVAIPDPAIAGVWMVKNLRTVYEDSMDDNCTVILYMAGYPDPFGKIRETNDFEEVEICI